ncbi:MAG: SdrD B-like domain-containing protein [Acidobacteriota bacterium]
MKSNNRFAPAKGVLITLLSAGLIGFGALSLDFASEAQSKAGSDDVIMAAVITGRAFQDYNGNGVYDTTSGLNSIDKGVAGVTVTAYDATGVARGTAITDAAGNYTLSATSSGPYRIEFTTIPNGYFPSARSTDSVSGGSATDSGSTVQFVSNSSTANVNVALGRPADYCQNNPQIVTSRFAQGAQNGAYSNNPAIYDFPYVSGTSYTDTVVANYDSPATHSLTTKVGAVGTIFSLAYNRSANRLYAGSYFKRHAGFGPGADGILNTADDMGAIYVINPSTSAVTNTFTVPGVTVNNHDTADYGSDNDDTGWNGVGKSGLGGMAIADDDSRLFVMNLEDRKLYALDPTTGVSLGSSVSVTTLSLPTPNGSRTTCRTTTANTNKRPFAVTYYSGTVYIGVVCTAESTADASDLYAYVFAVDPATLAINSTPTFSAALNHPRGFADPGAAAEWQPWATTIQSSFSYPQPMLTDIEFENGNLILGLRDRSGDTSLDGGANAKRTAGDTIRACGTVGSWTLESNGRCGGTGTAPQGTGQGPGNGEFYFQDDFCLTPNGANYHDEVSWGALLYIPGRQNVVSTVLDPVSRTIDSGATFDGGLRYFNNTSGATDRAYRIYNGTGGVGQPDFGKANGLGSLAALCSLAPIEIGNRVFQDSNGNGVQDAGENGIAGVTVHLYRGSALVGTAVTDANGEYYFVSSPVADPNTTDNIGQVNGGITAVTAYQVRLDRAADYNAGGPLAGRFLTIANQTSQAGDDDASDSDAVSVSNPSGSPTGTYPVVSLTTGSAGANNHTFDIGFVFSPSAAGVEISGRLVTSDGSGIRNVLMQLIEADGTFHAAISGPFGYYSFTDIPSGQAVVISVSAKRYHFAQSVRLVTLNDQLTSFDWVSQE